MSQFVIYLRKSRADAEAEARGEGETLARHEKELLNLALRLQLTVTAIYKEIVSGESIATRPVMQQLLSEVEQGVWDGCLVMEVERLARGDTIDQGIVAQAFKFSNTKICTPTKTYDPNNEFDEEYFEFGLFMSRREYKTINRRLQRGRLASVKEGKYVGNKPPYGYERVKIQGDKGYTLKIVKEEAEVVKMIYHWGAYGLEKMNSKGELVLEQVGPRAICRELNSLKIPAKISDRWTPESVRGILSNPVYCGYIRWNGRSHVKKMVNGNVVCSRPRNSNAEVYKGLHEAIVTEDLAKKAQQGFVGRSTVRADRELQNPLVGLVVCGKCGRNMFRRPHYNKKEHLRRDSLICSTVECKTVGSYLDIVENKVLVFLSEWLSQYKVELMSESANAVPNTIDSKKTNVEAYDTELLSLQKQLDKARDFLEKEIYTVDVFLDRSKTLLTKLEEVKHARSILLESINAEAKNQQLRVEVIPKIESVLSTYHLMPNIESKNKLLKTIIEKIVYHKFKKGIESFTLDIYPKMPPK